MLLAPWDPLTNAGTQCVANPETTRSSGLCLLCIRCSCDADGIFLRQERSCRTRHQPALVDPGTSPFQTLETIQVCESTACSRFLVVHGLAWSPADPGGGPPQHKIHQTGAKAGLPAVQPVPASMGHGDTAHGRQMNRKHFQMKMPIRIANDTWAPAEPRNRPKHWTDATRHRSAEAAEAAMVRHNNTPKTGFWTQMRDPS